MSPNSFIADRISTEFTACPDCDLLLSAAKSHPGYSSICPRCGAKLRFQPLQSVSKTLGLSITALLLYLPAMLMPLITFETFGFSDSANIIESILNFYQNKYYFVSLMILLSAVIFPLLLFVTIFIISLCLYLKRFPSYLSSLFKLHLHLEEWAMVEVYLIGILVTIIKMGDGSDVYYHSGLFCFAILVLMSSAISLAVDRQLFWQLIEHSGNIPHSGHSIGNQDIPMHLTAAESGLVLCHLCRKLVPLSEDIRHCPRCRSTLHLRKSSSFSRTWAFVLTASVLIFPANLLPIMEVDFLGVPDKSTILDGIIYFFEHKSYGIGLIIFTASVLVPIFKIVGLSILLLTRRPTSVRQLRQKTRMFRVIAFIGRWSMLDIFVIALLTVVADFGFYICARSTCSYIFLPCRGHNHVCRHNI